MGNRAQRPTNDQVKEMTIAFEAFKGNDDNDNKVIVVIDEDLLRKYLSSDEGKYGINMFAGRGSCTCFVGVRSQSRWKRWQHAINKGELANWWGVAYRKNDDRKNDDRENDKRLFTAWLDQTELAKIAASVWGDPAKANRKIVVVCRKGRCGKNLRLKTLELTGKETIAEVGVSLNKLVSTF